MSESGECSIKCCEESITPEDNCNGETTKTGDQSRVVCTSNESSSSSCGEVKSPGDNCNGETENKPDERSKDSPAPVKFRNNVLTPSSFVLRTSKLSTGFGSLPTTPSKTFVLNPPRLSNPFANPNNEPESKESDKDSCLTPKSSQKEEKLFTPLNKSSVSFLPLGAEATTPSQSASASFTTASTPSLGFVFGQNIHEKVEAAAAAENSNKTAAEPSSKQDTSEATTNGTDLLFSVQPPKENSDKNSEGGKSLSEAAREYEESRAVKRTFEEVAVVTGEEEEANVMQGPGSSKKQINQKDVQGLINVMAPNPPRLRYIFPPSNQNSRPGCTGGWHNKEVDKCISNIGEYEVVGMNVCKKLEKMSKQQAIFAESLINEVLTKGLLYQLTPCTHIAEKLPPGPYLPKGVNNNHTLCPLLDHISKINQQSIPQSNCRSTPQSNCQSTSQSNCQPSPQPNYQHNPQSNSQSTPQSNYQHTPQSTCQRTPQSNCGTSHTNRSPNAHGIYVHSKQPIAQVLVSDASPDSFLNFSVPSYSATNTRARCCSGPRRPPVFLPPQNHAVDFKSYRH